MSASAGWGIVAAALVLVAGLLLVLAGRSLRRGLGLGKGRTVALDNVTLTSRRLGLTGRPDRLIRDGGMVIPEEWKSSRTVWPNHRAQMGAYFLLIEDQLHVRPTHGVIVGGDRKRHRVESDERLRAWVLALADEIRAARSAMAEPIAVNPSPGQCRPCVNIASRPGFEIEENHDHCLRSPSFWLR
jgi:CRISPR-associated exonuclease Cas4